MDYHSGCSAGNFLDYTFIKQWLASGGGNICTRILWNMLYKHCPQCAIVKGTG